MLNEYYKLIGNEIREMVREIRHYGGYMHMISILTNQNIPIDIACKLLIKCGGDAKGVTAARKCINL